MLFVYLHTAFFGVSEWFFQNIPWSSHFPAFDVHFVVGFQPHGPSHGSHWVPPHGPQVAISGYAIMKYLDADEGFCAGRLARAGALGMIATRGKLWHLDGYRSKCKAWTTDLSPISTIWWLGYPILTHTHIISDLFVSIYQFEPQKYLECWGQPWSRGNSCNLLAKMTSLGKTWKNTKKVLKNRVLIRNTTMMWEQKYFVHSSSGRSEPPGMGGLLCSSAVRSLLMRGVPGYARPMESMYLGISPKANWMWSLEIIPQIGAWKLIYAMVGGLEHEFYFP